MQSPKNRNKETQAVSRNVCQKANRGKSASRLKSARRILLFTFYFLLPTSLFSQEIINHPELVWRTLETEHFRVNYHQGTARTANNVAKIAEDIYPAITGLYQYEPNKKVEFIIRDTQDYANGAAYFFDNKIEIWSENLDYVLRGTHNWLRDVITHEFTHIVSLQKALKFSRHVPAGWMQIFGYEGTRRPDVVRGFPNVLISYPLSGITIPVWYAEGVAQFQSPTKRFDYRDSHREMILRDRVMTGKVLGFQEMGHFGKNSIGNESSYNQGFAFVRYLSENYGDSVVSRLSDKAGAPLTLSFDGVIRKVTGKSATVLHREWRESLKALYTERLKTIEANLRTGEAWVGNGIGNMHPLASPDGKHVAYLATGDGDYLSQNSLVIENLETRKKTDVAAKITGSFGWSPDGKYLVYSAVRLTKKDNLFNDLFIYDMANKKSHRLTRGLRARHPDWSHDGNTVAFVVESDGLTHLFTLDVGDLNSIIAKDGWREAYYDLNAHQVLEDREIGRQKGWNERYRKVGLRGGKLTQLTRFLDGRQIFHPRWSPDDDYIIFDTSIGFARDIAKISPTGGKISFVLQERFDERYPIFHPKTGELIYACDETGIFNIYSLNLQTGEKKAYTNVVGGAFMPSFALNGDLFYSQYINQGYKIYRIPLAQTVAPEKMRYIEDYARKIPRLTANQMDQSVSDPLPSKAYQNKFSGVSIMPRLLVDYGTVKPGFYIYTNELLDRLSFFGGGDINRRGDYNLFGIFQFNLAKPTAFIEVFNQSANIKDRLSLPEFPTVNPSADVSFNLLQANVGLQGRFLPFKKLRELFYARLEYIFSLYKAKLGSIAFFDPVTNDPVIFSPLRYDYLRGHAISLFLRHDGVRRDLDRAINPRGGRYVTVRIQREWNRFLDDFATDRVVNIELFKKYYFNRFELNWEEYFSMPYADRHSLTLRFQGGFIDAPVDSFFHFFGGGLIGLKGYPFYSVEGRRMTIGTATYRFPLLRNINKQILNMYFDKLYLGGFVQYGNAWSNGKLDFNDFLGDLGLQLRLDTFSWYFFPTRIFFEAAYPLKEHFNNGVHYPKEWKFYFGVLFDFDLRLENRPF